jgi:hypothetical protein
MQNMHEWRRQVGVTKAGGRFDKQTGIGIHRADHATVLNPSMYPGDDHPDDSPCLQGIQSSRLPIRISANN